MTTISATPTSLSTLSTCDLSTVNGGAPVAGDTRSPQIFNATQADQMKRQLDREFGFRLGDPGRAVCRTVPGHPGQFTVQTPRIDGHGTRITL